MPGKRYDRQFKLSAARLVLKGEIPVKGLPDQLNVPCCTLRRWAGYEADGEGAFPGSGNPVANKDYEMLKLKKESEGLRKDGAILKNLGLLEASPSVRFELVRTGKHGTGVKKACGALGVGRGGKASDKGTNVLNREFSVQKRDSVWCDDIIYIPTREG